MPSTPVIALGLLANNKRKGNGTLSTQLGLAICKKFAELMNGSIEAESTPGEGSCFTFLIPAIAVDEKQEDSEESDKDQNIESAPEGLIKVLVIDDDETSLDISRRILSKRGYSVITASRGETGVDLAVDKKPDVIVLDVIMPEMDGWQVLEKLRETPETADIPIIMQSMLSERELGLAKGADDYLTKPVDQVDLTNAIRKLLPEPSLGKGLLVIEEGTTIVDLLEENNDQQAYELLHTADLHQAEEWVRERLFGIIIVGQHTDMEGVSKLMDSVNGISGSPPTPVLLLNSIQMETLDTEQLLSYIKIRKQSENS